MHNCPFCNIDTSKIYNTIFEETKNFVVMTTKGSLTDGYIIIVSKKHFYNILELDENIKQEYFSLINKYRIIFKNIYKKYPIIFEHGASNNSNSASSIIHAHSHIVNHNFKDENNFLKELNFKDYKNDTIGKKSYLFYISPLNKSYISYDFKPVSQLIRIYIARDLEIEDKYNWKSYELTSNIKKTINNIKNY